MLVAASQLPCSLSDVQSGAARCRFGLDCPDHVIWSGWEAGGEYHRTLVVQNVSDHTVRFNYKLPQSKYFTMSFPEPVKLMAGMSIPLEITFRPVKQLPYR